MNFLIYFTFYPADDHHLHAFIGALDRYNQAVWDKSHFHSANSQAHAQRLINEAWAALEVAWLMLVLNRGGHNETRSALS